MDENTNLQLEIEEKKKKLEQLKQYAQNVNEKEKLDNEEKQLLNTLHKKEVVRKYPRLFAFSRAWANFWSNLFSGMGRAIRKAGNALEKSDKFIAEQTIKENEHKIQQLKQEAQMKTQKTKKGMLEEAGDID